MCTQPIPQESAPYVGGVNTTNCYTFVCKLLDYTTYYYPLRVKGSELPERAYSWSLADG